MNREDLIKTLAKFRNNIPSISGAGFISRLLWVHAHEDASIYQMDMSYPTAMCVGLALATPDQKVLSVEGDGSIIMGMGVFTTISRYQPENLVVCIVDNGVFGSAGEGEVETATSYGTDIAEVARACGISADKAVSVSSTEAASKAFELAFSEPGPWVIVAKVEKSDLTLVRNPKNTCPYDIVESSIKFRRAMCERGYS